MNNPRFRFLTDKELVRKLEQHSRWYIESDDPKFLENTEVIENELVLRRAKK